VRGSVDSVYYRTVTVRERLLAELLQQPRVFSIRSILAYP
jgi:hypothetical protein